MPILYCSQRFFAPTVVASDEDATIAMNTSQIPANILKSKRVPAWAEAVIVPFNKASHSKVYNLLKSAQNEIMNIIKGEVNINAHDENNKKPFKHQRTLHGTIIPLILPTSTNRYLQRLGELNSVGIAECLEKMIEKKLTYRLDVCRFNEDGNIIVRFHLDQLHDYKMQLKDYGAELRYADPERDTTIAVVLATVDRNVMSNSAIDKINEILQHLSNQLAEQKFLLKTIEIVDCLKRTVAPSTIWHLETFKAIAPSQDNDEMVVSANV